MTDLMKCLREIKRKGRQDALHAEEVTVVHDFKSTVQPHFPQHFKGHRLPLGFRFRKIHGVTQLHVRKHAMANWCPNEEDNQYDREALGPDLGYLVLKVSGRAKMFQMLTLLGGEGFLLSLS